MRLADRFVPNRLFSIWVFFRILWIAMLLHTNEWERMKSYRLLQIHLLAASCKVNRSRWQKLHRIYSKLKKLNTDARTHYDLDVLADLFLFSSLIYSSYAYHIPTNSLPFLSDFMARKVAQRERIVAAAWSINCSSFELPLTN